jgi:hypothetical protein
MPYLKKSLFGIIFLVLFTGFHFFLMPLLQSYEWIFGLNQSSANQLTQLAILLILSAFSYVIFAALCNDRRIGVSMAVVGALIPLLFSQSSTGMILSGFYLLALIGCFFMVENTMRHYYNFSPILILTPLIKNLFTALLFIICLGYYLSINSIIKQSGFAIPESVIPDAIVSQLISQQSSQLIKGDKYLAQLPQLTPEQLQLLKQNPDILRQYGVDPAILEQYETTTTSAPSTSAPSSPGKNSVQVPPSSTASTESIIPSVSMIKKMALAPINDMLNKYQFLIAPILALLLFSAFSFISFIFFFFNLISGGLMKLVFYLLEKSGFVRYEKEMREVQKLIV